MVSIVKRKVSIVCTFGQEFTKLDKINKIDINRLEYPVWSLCGHLNVQLLSNCPRYRR